MKTQPDGAQFMARLVGDEWSNAEHTLDGFAIVLNEASGFWVYADKVDGQLVPTALVVGRDLPGALTPRLMPDRAAGRGNDPVEVMAPVLGVRKLLVILVQYNNRAAITTAADWQTRMFGATNSVKDHYLKSSYNQMTVTPAEEANNTTNDGIIGWLNIAQPHPNTANNITGINQQITKDAIVAADSYVNFAAFDTNANGSIEVTELDIVVIVAGYESSYSGGCSPRVWGHKWVIQNAPAFPPPTVDGKVVAGNPGGGYAQFGELHCSDGTDTHQATIGIMAHELGHMYGMPDLYDTDQSSEGVGEWSLMGSGSWNTFGGADSGTWPSLMDAWCKSVLGWVTPTLVNNTLFGESISTAATTADVYQLGSGVAGVSGEYFLVENRQRTSYDSGLKTAGLVIWHIDEAMGTQTQECAPGGVFGVPACSNAVHFRVAVVQADNLYNLERQPLDPAGNRSDTGDTFPGATNNRSFNRVSGPNSAFYSGTTSKMGVASISDSQATMTATLLKLGGTFTDPTLTAGVSLIKALNITELRARIDSLRLMKGLGVFAWTTPSLVAGGSVLAAHVSQLQTALIQAYNAAPAVAPPTFTEVAVAGMVIKAIHIMELRAAVTVLEGS